MRSQSLSGSWELREVGGVDVYAAQVPGGVHTDLLAAGCLPDPFVADNELKVQWVAEKDWEYRRAFDVSADFLKEEQIFLVCDGLDTLGQAFLNGQELGRFENMFRQYRWDVKSLLNEGRNDLVLVFESVVAFARKNQEQRPLLGVSQAIPGGPHVRKAPCQFGWDWGPMLPPVGIWKDLRLEGFSQARLEDVHLRQKHQEGKVELSAHVSVVHWSQAPLQAELVVTAPDGKTLKGQAQINGPEVMLSLTIDNPQMWWPNGYGDHPLYAVEVSLLSGEGVLETRSYKMGLRTIELRQEPDEWGKSWMFVVNGVPVFAKGGNWIPADSFPTRLTREFLDNLISSAAEANHNMLRIWGGGLYESEDFYDLCDEKGILVWQEFLFSCSSYPWDNDAYLENVRAEVDDNMRRIRHRASLCLWCGNNEIETGFENWGWKAAPEYPVLSAAYEKFYFHTLPAWVAELDPDTAYWPSSPSSNTPFINVNGEEQGDMHYWDVWHGRKPFTAYRSTHPRFMSEFGFQSLPPLETIRTYAEEKDWNMTSYIMEHHQRSGSGNGLMMGQMTDSFRMPKDFSSLVYLSMVLQAEGIRYGVEHWRRQKQRVSGILYWQLNDCWPVASWASLDYFGRWKALHYMSRRFFAPVMLSIEDHFAPISPYIYLDGGDPQRMDVWMTSDLNLATSGVVRWWLMTLGGEVLESGEEPEIRLEPQASQQIFSKSFQLSREARRFTIFACELLQPDADGFLQRAALNVAPFAANKHLELSDPLLRVEVSQVGDRLAFDVNGSSLARFVELSLEGQDVVFSDNYFDLPAGMTVRVTCPLPAGWSLKQATQALRTRSLVDSF